VLPREVDIDALREVRDLGCDHIRWQVGQELFAAVLAAEPCRVLRDLASAVF